jgi:alanine-glyoxylate transaminase / serine-glyoxylate transaminase / serine-pyruvate transaminase
MNEEQSSVSGYPELTMTSRILLGPGPSMVHPRVLQSMASPLVGHLDPYFITIMDQTQELLRYVFETNNQLTIPISGTGSAAMEASMANFVEPGSPVLICVNGYFGGRLADMASRYSGDVQTIHKPWGEVFSPEEVEEALKKRPSKVVGIVHAETSTGACQPLDDIAKLVHAQGGILVVDAVTSLGGLSVGVDRVGIDVCYSGTQKCLSVPPGLGPLTVSPRAVQVLNERKTKVPNWYLDLTMVHAYWGEARTYHHTAPISAVFGLYEGLRLIAEEGLEKRWKRHLENAKLFWNGLADIGLELHVAEEYRLPSLHTVRVPNGVDEAVVRRKLLEEYYIEIAGGLGELKGKVWRIGLMGFSSRNENIQLLLTALKNILK